MRWRGRRRSVNVQDRRGRRVSRPVAVGGVGGLGLLVLLVVGLFLGVDPTALLQNVQGPVPAAPPSAGLPSTGSAGDDGAEFVAVVLADTEQTWNTLFNRMGTQYREPQLVLFTDGVRSACGFAQSATGPFYCPGDRQVYIDLGFFGVLRDRFRAPGDFAQAYVVAHEVGHHVQTLLGISEQVHAARRSLGETESNALQVRMELQADCYAGVWAYYADRVLGVVEPGDIEEALTAASAIGDDNIQRRSRGYVVPESFTHGTSEQRMRWFHEGYRNGDPRSCDTFGG